VLHHYHTKFKHLKTYTMSKQIDKNKKIFNWGEVSRIFSGTRSVIRHDSIPKVHEPIINEMIDAVQTILKKHGIIK